MERLKNTEGKRREVSRSRLFLCPSSESTELSIRIGGEDGADEKGEEEGG